MNNNNNNYTTHSDIESVNIQHGANQPKLQWLLILIPVAGVFAMYTFYRVRYKKRKRSKLEEGTTVTSTTMMGNIIPVVPPSIFNLNNRSQINNSSDISLVRLPHSDRLYIPVNNMTGRESRTLSAPPPVYSISSPPVYEDVVDLRTNNHPNSTS